MKLFIVDMLGCRIELSVEDLKAVRLANILETSDAVKSFYVEGMNCKNQQAAFGAGGFAKWLSPIQQ